MEQMDANDKRYPRQGLAYAIRWIFLHWWLIPLICLMIAVILYLVDILLYSQPFAFFTGYWWQIILFLVVGAGLLFLAYKRAEVDETPESGVLWRREYEPQQQEPQQQELQQQERQQRQRELELQSPPTGLTLQHSLSGHTGVVYSVAWSPDSRLLASASSDKTIRLWDTQTSHLLYIRSGHTSEVNSVAWSPDGRLLASASDDKTIRLWDTQTFQPLHTFSDHAGAVDSVAWSPDGRLLASASSDSTIRLWDTQTTQPLHTLSGHSDRVLSVVWSPDGRLLASASVDSTIRLWEAETGREVRRLERHTGPVSCVSFSGDGRLLASKSGDGTVRFWDVQVWEEVAVLHESVSGYLLSSLAFHPQRPLLATVSEEDIVIRTWHVDVETLMRHAPASATAHYTNAKVVLVGDSGVGKSGLGLVLAKHAWKATESTHGRYVWTFDEKEVELKHGRRETRETLLWDLAGQLGYRLIHQLHLNEVSVALVVFDARSETDPFAGVYHWERALRIAQEKQGSGTVPLKKFLVAARCDRGGIGVSAMRLEVLRYELGFDGYFETSAKEGMGIEQLQEAIAGAIDWERLPKVSSTQLFQDIKAFLVVSSQYCGEKPLM